MYRLPSEAILVGEHSVIAATVAFLAPTRDQADCRVIIGDHVTIRDGTIVYGGVKIGNRVTIDHFCVIREGVVIGDGSRIKNFTEIGRDVSIGAGCRVAGLLANRSQVGDDTSSFGHLIHSYPIHGANIVEASPVLGRQVIVGRLAVIAGNVKIPDGVRVAAGSITTARRLVSKVKANHEYTSILTHFHREHLALAKQSESQLGQFNMILVPVIAACVALALILGLGIPGFIIGTLVVVVGTYGFTMANKYLEAYWKHYSRAQLFTDRIEELYPDLGITSICEQIRINARSEFRLTGRISVKYVIQFLYGITMLLGFAIIIVSAVA